MMRSFLLVSVGGILGANARFLVSLWVARRWPASFPYGTLVVNASGTFLLGMVVTLAEAASPAGVNARLLLGTGFCGAYTTFSTFSFECVALARQRGLRPALANVTGNVGLCLATGLAGILLGRMLA